VVRKTQNKVTGGDIIVGDFVRFRDLGTKDEAGRPEGVIEALLPRKTVLTRSDSFKQIESHPVVANAEQMLIVVSVREPEVKWGLVDRMIIAAQSGGLVPIVCLNKVDLITPHAEAKRSGAPAKRSAAPDPDEVLRHYESLNIKTLQTSIPDNLNIGALGELLRNRTTVLAGHSGVGKSSLIRALQPALDLRIGAISGYTGKGRHTTTSTRRYVLEIGGQVIDTPGVKLFGLWDVTRENLIEHFPDVESGTAPPWRQESYERIKASLAQ
jgi:ribosome biogenesis GTPase